MAEGTLLLIAVLGWLWVRYGWRDLGPDDPEMERFRRRKREARRWRRERRSSREEA